MIHRFVFKSLNLKNKTCNKLSSRLLVSNLLQIFPLGFLVFNFSRSFATNLSFQIMTSRGQHLKMKLKRDYEIQFQDEDLDLHRC